MPLGELAATGGRRSGPRNRPLVEEVTTELANLLLPSWILKVIDPARSVDAGPGTSGQVLDGARGEVIEI